MLELFGFAASLVILIAGAEVLVRGAIGLARVAGISTLVIGLTVVSFGTSAPELAISVRSALSTGGGGDIALGNAVGSNIANVLLIIGLSAAAAPIVVSGRLTRLDLPIMIGTSIALLPLAADGRIDRIEGILLLAGIAGYILFTWFHARKDSTAGPIGERKGGQRSQIFRSIFLTLIGLVLLISGANWLVKMSVLIARELGVSELVISLSLVAVGTSLPEIATSLTAALRGEREIAVGNAVGSNIFNILAVLGTAAVVAPGGINVPAAALGFDIPVMIAVAIACLPVFFTDHRITRFEGWLFLAYYFAYVAYIFLDAQDHDALPIFSNVMLTFIIPFTTLVLLVAVVRQIRFRK